MNLEQIKSFISVAKTGNYSTAAKERFITQPAISNQIKALEEELDVKLFERNQKGIMLTEKGRKFQKYANQMLITERDMLNCVREADDEYYGMLDIAAPWLTITNHMDDFFVEATRQKGQEAVLRVYQKEEEEITKMVLNGEIDLGISNHRINHKNLVYEEAYTEEIVLITPNQDKYRNLSSEDLRNLLLEEGHIRYDFGTGHDFLWNDFFGRVLGINLHNIKTVSNTSQFTQQLAAVEAGLGIGFISTSCMQKEWKEGRVLAYRCKNVFQKPYYVIYDKNRMEKSEVLRDVKELLVEYLKKCTEYPEQSF